MMVIILQTQKENFSYREDQVLPKGTILARVPHELAVAISSWCKLGVYLV
jgi:hypothetical protein